jgi:hypothetical protein
LGHKPLYFQVLVQVGMQEKGGVGRFDIRIEQNTPAAFGSHKSQARSNQRLPCAPFAACDDDIHWMFPLTQKLTGLGPAHGGATLRAFEFVARLRDLVGRAMTTAGANALPAGASAGPRAAHPAAALRFS